MVRDTKQTQPVKKTKGTGKFLPAALFALSISTGNLNAESRDIALETSIWTSDLQDMAKLEKTAVRALQINPGPYEHYLVAELSLRLFKNNPQELRYLKQASDMSQQAIDLAPTQEYGYLVAAQVMDLMGYKEDASEMLADRPSFAKGWRTSFVRGVIAASHDGDKTSFAEFDKSLKAPDVSKEIVGSYIAMNLEGNYTGNELVQKLELWHKKAQIPAMKVSLARALEENGDAVRAHAILEALNKTNPEDETLLQEASLLVNKLSRSKDAEKILKDLIAKSPSEEIRSNAEAYLAKISLIKGDMRAASKLFAEAIDSSDEKLKWISFAQRSYQENHRVPEFSALLSYLTEILPGSSYLYALQGEVLSEGLAQHEKAIASYEAAITLDPRRSEFYNGLGLAYYRMKKHDKALATFDKAIKIDPKDATARYNEACVLALMGRGDEAVGSLQKAIFLDGRLQRVASTDKDFEGIRSNAQFQNLVKTEKPKNPNAVLTKGP